MNLIRTLADATMVSRWKAETALRAIGVLMSVFGGLILRPARRTSPPAYGSDVVAGARTVLIVSYYAPPYQSTHGTQRIAKFAKYLSAQGWKVVLLTTEPRNADEVDTGGEPLSDAVEVIRMPAMRYHPLVRKGLIPPDHFLLWVPEARREIRQICDARHISAILATVPPYSNAVAAALASRETGVPLVVDFRDPWTKIDVEWVLRNPISRKLNEWLEHAVLRASSRIVMVDPLEYVRDYFVDHDQSVRRKIVSIANGYDEEDFVGLERVSSSDQRRFCISYVGGLYGQENADNLAAIFEAWSRRNPQTMSQVLFEYAGGNGELLARLSGLPMDFRNLGYVSHRESIRIRMRSHLQLFAQPLNFKKHVMSGKIYEILRVGVPVLALTHLDGGVASLLRRASAGVVLDPRDSEGAATELQRAFDRWKAGANDATPTPNEFVAGYSRARLSGRLSDVLLDVVDGREPASSRAQAESRS